MVGMAILYRAPDGTAFSSRDAIDEQYDLVASVPDFGVYLNQFLTESERARAELDCEIGVPYGPTLAETLDVFPGDPGGPIVVFVHGGYWSMLTSTEHSYLARGPVGRGATVMIPTYALCPTVTIDEIVRQVRASVAWAYRNGEKYGADPSRIVVVGHSAGGHLVARLLETDWEGEYGLPNSIISGGVAVSGLFDLRPFPYTKMQPNLEFTAEQILRNSPILNLPVSAPPLLVTLGSLQPRELLRQSSDYFAAWQAAGLAGEHWVRDGFNHFDELDALTDPQSELVGRLLALAARS